MFPPKKGVPNEMASFSPYNPSTHHRNKHNPAIFRMRLSFGPRKTSVLSRPNPLDSPMGPMVFDGFPHLPVVFTVHASHTIGSRSHGPTVRAFNEPKFQICLAKTEFVAGIRPCPVSDVYPESQLIQTIKSHEDTYHKTHPDFY